jgi:ubiquinone/menaquinone biosynthesis C-methylase UbiE
MNIEEQKKIWNDPNMWIDDGNEWSIFFGTTDNLWNIIYPKFEKYINGEVLEIAPGFGRITEYLLQKNSNLSVVDLNEICIEKCKYKFKDKIKKYIINDGKSLDFNNEYFDFVFSYDSFVHMTEDVIESYIKEISRTLKHNGYSFIHHSFFYGSETPSLNLAGRSNMTPDLFKNIVEKYNMEIISQENFQVSENITDVLSIFYKK